MTKGRLLALLPCALNYSNVHSDPSAIGSDCDIRPGAARSPKPSRPRHPLAGEARVMKLDKVIR